MGCIGFGGPPTHIAILRSLCVDRRGWLSEHEFEDGVAATNLLPGPASTQLAILCAWRLRGWAGAVTGGVCFIVPGLVLLLGLSAMFLKADPPTWIEGAAAGAGAAVPVVAVHAATGLMPASWRRSGRASSGRARWLFYVGAGATAAATVGPFLVLILITCGLIEVAMRRGIPSRWSDRFSALFLPAILPGAVGGMGALAWVAFKVGALSYGGGFVIIPMMQHDAVTAYHWMTDSQFLGVVALGQITPGPVVQTVAGVGYAAAGLGGGLLAAAIAFAPSFAFVLVGGPRFDRLRASDLARAFLAGAGPAAIGAIAGAALPLALAIGHLWQVGVLFCAAIWLLVLRKGVVAAIVGAGALGVLAALASAPVR
jgi:chromate transporter